MVKVSKRSESRDNLVISTRISNRRVPRERIRTRLEKIRSDPTRSYNVSNGDPAGNGNTINEDEELVSDFADIKDAIYKNRESIPRYIFITIFILIAAYQSVSTWWRHLQRNYY